MKISASDMAFTASHESWQTRDTDTRINARADPRRDAAGNTSGFSIDFHEQTRVAVSEAGRSLLAASQRQALEPPRPSIRQTDSATASNSDEQDSGIELPARLQLLRDLVEAMTGRKMHIMTSAELTGDAAPTATPPAQPSSQGEAASAATGRAGWGIEYDYREVNESYERSDFRASGRVTLEDGRVLKFDFALSMARYHRDETNVSIRAGDQRAKDPLILNLDGATPASSGDSIRFDLFEGGEAERLPLLNGSAYLALDANQNGRIDDGRELFGPRSDDGFAELAQLDQDHNGWIDESDSAFSQLRLWRPAPNGAGSLQTLTEAGVGALYLGKVETPFALKDANGSTVGAVRSSGVYLKESGAVGALQQIDVAA